MTTASRTGIREQILRWFAVFGGAAAWGIHLGGSYLLVPFACRTGLVVLLHLTTVATVAFAVIAAIMANRLWSNARHRVDTTRAGVDRDRFLAATGLFLNSLFAVLNVFEGLPVFLIDPCIGGS